MKNKKLNIQEDMIDKQYERLINARNFHYNNFNKWLMAFYAIIGALFIAFYTINKEEASNFHTELFIAIMGYIVSIACYLSGKGYYYWEINWIKLIHHFEKKYLATNDNDVRVYSVMANKEANNSIWHPVKGANISTSKLALLIAFLTVIAWGGVVAHLIIQEYFEICICCKLLACLIAVLLSYILTCLGAKIFSSDLKNLDDLKL